MLPSTRKRNKGSARIKQAKSGADSATIGIKKHQNIFGAKDRDKSTRAIAKSKRKRPSPSTWDLIKAVLRDNNKIGYNIDDLVVSRDAMGLRVGNTLRDWQIGVSRISGAFA